ncbi:hypothetical protein AALC25_00135 [Lachnospiraceae bacterium 29-84]
MDKEKLKAFVDRNKAKIAIGTGAVAGGILFVVMRKHMYLPKSGKNQLMQTVSRVKDIPVPAGFAVGEVKGLWKESGYLNAIMEGITTDDLGKLGKEFVEKGLVADGTSVSAVIGFLE